MQDNQARINHTLSQPRSVVLYHNLDQVVTLVGITMELVFH